VKSVCAVVLAAGVGKRMQSELPKVLHRVCWHPLVALVRSALREAGVERVITVVPPGDEAVRSALGPDTVFATQQQPLGTADAAKCALPALGDASAVLVLYGDVPLLTASTLKDLVSSHLKAPPRTGRWALSLLTAVVGDPAGYGRVVRDRATGAFRAIVEEVECTPDQASIAEINTGIYCFERSVFERYLPRVPLSKAKGEYYLSDLPRMLIAAGERVQAVAGQPDEILGINSREQLAAAEGVMRRRQTDRLMASGVTVVDPATTYVAPGVVVGKDTVIYPGSYLLPGSTAGRGCTIGPGAYLDAARLGDFVRVWYSTVEGSEVGDRCSIGPYAHLRPGTILRKDVRVGNFAEIKNSTIGAGGKISHHSYVGDADLGEGVNIGAGVVFVNYDGIRKYRTTVGDGAFIGCNANLVAPLTLGDRAYVACGSSLVKDVPAEALAIARPHQRNIPGWVRRRRAGTGGSRTDGKEEGKEEDRE